MRELGYAEGTDFTNEWRFAEGRYERFEVFAAEVTSLPVDVIVLGMPAAVGATQQATSTIPIVMGYSTDPVGNGFVVSLARPGGNTTGLASLLEEVVAKQVELLRATVPNAQRLAILSNPGNANSVPVLASARASAKRLGFDLMPLEARTAAEIENAFATMRDLGASALIVSSDAFFHSQSRLIGELALQQRVPSIFSRLEVRKPPAGHCRISVGYGGPTEPAVLAERA
jgi:putative ABC transport system substrate-binding protein